MIIETLLLLFIKGALLGLVVTAPPGPIALLIRRISGGLIIAFGVVVLGYAGTLL